MPKDNLISRQAALDIIDSELNGWLTDDERLHLEGVAIGISCLPTIDPVKHGKWESDEFLYTTGQTICSACKTGFYVDDLLNVGEGAQEFLPNYCPHCGARMDGE